MKRTLFQSIIREVISEGITAYHGSPKKFDRFDLSFLGTGDGRSVYGDGVYLSLKRDEAETYSNNGYLYTVDVAGYNGDNYVLWNGPLGRGIAGRVAEALKKEGAPECDELSEKILEDGGKMKGEMLFMYLREIFYPNQLGELFRTANVSGALVPSKTVARRDRLIDLVIYRPEDIRITNVETVGKTTMNESLSEGGNAVPSAQPVRGDLAGEIAKDVINAVSSTFNCEAEPAGSTGKKGREMTSGDIDILLGLPWEKSEEVAQRVKENFPNCEMAVQPGFKQISFGYQYDEDGTPKVAQVDLMFTGNISWRRWSAYSPSPYDEEYREHGIEKAFKGLVQTVLLKAIATVKPLVIDELPQHIKDIAEQYNVFESEEFQPGEADAIYAKRMKREEKERMENPEAEELKRPARKPGVYKSWWYYMWDAEEGLVLAKKSYAGANGKGLLIDPKIQGKTPPITNNVDEALKLILGPAATTDVLKNPITMVKYLFSGNYPYATPENLRRIHNVVVYNDQIKGMPGVVENFEKVWDRYANHEEEKPQGEPVYSAAIQEIHDLYRRMKKTEE